MSKPESRGPGRAPLPAVRANAFFHHPGRTGSVTVAADRAQLRRTTLYQMRQDDDAFAERWARALDPGVERLQDNAMNRARDGTEHAMNFQTVPTIGPALKRIVRFKRAGDLRFSGQTDSGQLVSEKSAVGVHAGRTTRTPRTTPDNGGLQVSFLACLKGPVYRRFFRGRF